MIFSEIKLYRYRLPLVRPIAVKGENYRMREGLILRVTDESGEIGLGEIAPLPGYSIESLDQALSELQSISKLLNSMDDVDSIASELSGCSASVRFGIESALRMFGLEGTTIFTDLEDANSMQSTPLNALADLSDPNCLTAIAKALDAGYETIKLKAGRQPVANDIDSFNKVASTLPASGALRLDCNRSWSIDDLAQFTGSTDMNRIEYIEEPLRNLSDYDRLPSSPRIPIAFDETLSRHRIEKLHSIQHLTTLVLKPSILGLSKSASLIEFAREHSLEITFSSCFESSLGIALIANIAASACCTEKAAGLDTINWFERDLFVNKLSIESGRLQIPAIESLDSNIDYSMLSEVSLA